MSKTRKPSRKELKKDDEFVVKGQEIVKKASEYSRPLIGAGVVFVLIVSVAIGTSILSRARASAGALAMGEALEIVDRPILEAAEGVDLGRDAFSSEAAKNRAFKEALNKVRADHARTPAAALAALYLGRIAMDEERYDDALEEFQRYLSEAPRNHSMRFVAIEGVGAAEEARKELDAALKAYRRLAKESPDSYLPFGLVHEARVLTALGRSDEARKTAQRVVDEHAGTAAARMARDLIGRLPSADDSSDTVADVSEAG